MGKTKSSKNKPVAGSKPTTSAPQPSATDLIGESKTHGSSGSECIAKQFLRPTAQAHAYLGQSNFEQAINSLALALDIEPANREALEILGIAEIEGGDVDKGREVSSWRENRLRLHVSDGISLCTAPFQAAPTAYPEPRSFDLSIPCPDCTYTSRSSSAI